ncbi:MAG: PEP-CTERM sorting domain-containing protein [Planctomycetota bacterium]|nr:PEP-CTERM sorting domain-containing protein [Planctomycetota bacterium]
MVSRHVSSMVGVCTALVLVAGMTGSASATTIVSLDDLNSHVGFDTSSGVMSWTVDSIQQLKQQWFFYRLHGTTQELPLSSLGYVKSKANDANFSPGNETLNAVYGSEAGFSVTLTYVLAGGLNGTGKSDLQETIAFNNKTSAPVRLQFFQYCDFDLNGTPSDDTVSVVNANCISQRDVATMAAETVVTPSPARTEVAVYHDTLDKLTNTVADDLDNSKNPIGPADVTWAFQWDLTVAAGGTVQISKDKNMVPEPATLCLLGAGAVGLVVRRFRRK